MFYIAMLSDHYFGEDDEYIKTKTGVMRRIGFVSGMSAFDVFYDTFKKALSFESYETAVSVVEYMRVILIKRGNIDAYKLVVCELKPTIDYYKPVDSHYEIEDDEYDVKIVMVAE